MAHDDERLNILERALLEGYRSRSNVSDDPSLTDSVMGDIRRSAEELSRRASTILVDQLVWRTATITAAVVLIGTMVTVSFLRPPAWDSHAFVVEEFESVPLFEE
jgi:hypothetical protein